MGEEKHLSAQGGVAHADASEEVLSPLFPSSADTSSEDLPCGASAGAQPGADAPEEKKPGRHGRHEIDLADKSSRRKLIIELAWPALAENLLSSLVSMVDTIMVGGLGAYAISAVGLVTQPKFIMLAMFIALNVGSTALVARMRGANDREGANRVLQQSIFLSFFISVVLCGLMLIFCKPLIHFIAGPDISAETIAAGLDYFRIQLYGFPAVALTFAINSCLRGVGNTRASFYTNLVANLVNVFFNYCFIGGNLGFPRLEVAGASIATVIGQCAGLCMAVCTLLRGKQYIGIDRKIRFCIDFSIIRRILNIGIPAMVEQLMMRTGMMIYTLIVTRLGDLAYAAHIIGMNIQQLSFTSGMAFGTAATTLTGQCLGRKKPELAKTYMRETIQLGFFISLLIAVTLFFFGKDVTLLYTQDMQIITLCTTVLKIIAVIQPLQSARLIYTSGLRGAGDARFTAVITFVGIVIVRPVLSLILVNIFGLGLIGAWISLVSDQIICYFLARGRYKKGKWTTIKV